MTIITTESGKTKLVADEGMAIHRIGTATPSSVVSVILRDGDSPDGFEDCELGEPERQNSAVRYSVRSIIRELKAVGRFAAVRALLEGSNYDWDFIGSNYLASDDADFQTMLAAVVESGIMTQAELDAMLPKCVWSAD